MFTLRTLSTCCTAVKRGYVDMIEFGLLQEGFSSIYFNKTYHLIKSQSYLTGALMIGKDK